MRRVWNEYRADIAMASIVVLWGINFVVVKDALNYLPPVTFNAMRFLVGSIGFIPLAIIHRRKLKFTRRDLWVLVAISIVGQAGYQVFFVLSLSLTTSTNAALLTSTMPTFTALISVAAGIILWRRGLLLGLAITTCGVVMVILSHSNGQLMLTHDDMSGSLLALVGAVAAAIYTVVIAHLVARYGGMATAIVAYWATCLGLVGAALPDLITLREIPSGVFPHLFYGGIITSLAGYLVSNYAIKHLGATRTAMYNNITPIAAGISGIIVLNEPLSAMLILGGAITLAGVAMTRNFTTKAHAPPPVIQPAIAAAVPGD